MGRQVVHDDRVAALECGHQHLLDVGLERHVVQRAVEHHGRGHAVDPERAREGRGLPVPMRHGGTGNALLSERGLAAGPSWLRR